VPVIGDIEYDLSEIVIQSLQLPTNQLNLDPKVRGVSGSMSDVSASVTLKWHYKVEMWPNPSDSGTAKISISQTTVCFKRKKPSDLSFIVFSLASFCRWVLLCLWKTISRMAL